MQAHLSLPCSTMRQIGFVSLFLSAYLYRAFFQDNCDLTKLAECHQRIFNTNIGQVGKPDVSWGNCILYGLIKYLRKPSKSEEKEHFLKVTFPAIIELALKVETLLPTEGIVISEQQVGKDDAYTTFLSKQPNDKAHA